MKIVDLGLIFNETFCDVYKRINKKSSATLEIDPLRSSIMFAIITTCLEGLFYIHFEWQTLTIIWLYCYHLLFISVQSFLTSTLKNNNPTNRKSLDLIVQEGALIGYLYEDRGLYSWLNRILYAGFLAYMMKAGDVIPAVGLLILWLMIVVKDKSIGRLARSKHYNFYMRRLEG